MCFWVSPVSLAVCRLICRLYRLSCSLLRTAFRLYLSTCNSVRGLTCYDVGKLLWSFQRGAWVLDGVGVGFMVGWGFSRASKILFGDMECSSFRWVFFKTQHK